jgi:hypothetical protein
LRYGQQARVWVRSENELVEIVVDDNGREFRLPPARPYFQPFIALNRPAIVQPADVGLRKPGGTASKTNAPFYVSDRKKLCSIAGAVRTRCGAHIQGTIAGNTLRRQRQF